MEVTIDLVDKLAHLSKLSFTETEKETIATDLQKMIGMVEKMQEVDTSNVEPLLHMSAAKNVFRKDVVADELTAAQALENAPKGGEAFFRVPKVISK